MQTGESADVTRLRSAFVPSSIPPQAIEELSPNRVQTLTLAYDLSERRGVLIVIDGVPVVLTSNGRHIAAVDVDDADVHTSALTIEMDDDEDAGGPSIKVVALRLARVLHFLHVARDTVAEPWPPSLQSLATTLDDEGKRRDLFALIHLVYAGGNATGDLHGRLLQGHLAHLYDADPSL